MSSSYRKSILNPVINLNCNSNNVNFLIDTGASESIISASVFEPEDLPQQSQKRIFNCFKSKVKTKTWNHESRIYLPNGDKIVHEFTVVPDFNIKFHVPSLRDHVQRCHYKESLSPDFTKCIENNDLIVVHGILGVDFIKNLTPFEVQTVTSGETYLRVSNGFIPFGILDGVSSPRTVEKVSIHLTHRPIKKKVLKNKKSASQMGQSNEKAKVHLKENLKENFKENDVATVGKGKRDIRKAKNVNRNKTKIEKATSAEVAYELATFVLKDDDDIDADEIEKIEKSFDNYMSLDRFDYAPSKMSQVNAEEIRSEFTDKNIFKNREINKYEVDIDWDESMLARVPNNYSICKVIAQRVHQKTVNQGFEKEYIKIFEDQLEAGIIEPLETNFDVSQHKFVTHRPIVRQDPLVKTTKIRCVLNCSLRINNKPSVNDCVSFPPDLLSDILDLIFLFRSNNFFVMSDIKQAFLNIRLGREKDRNCFSIIVYDGSKYKYYRFCAVLFGFVQSPYFLQCVLKCHAFLARDPTVKEMLQNNFYVDNFINTSNDVQRLKKESVLLSEHLTRGGFHLREWISNNKEVIKDFPIEDVDSTDKCVKVLGYQADPKFDTMQVKNTSLNEDATTKRAILSSINSIFDPAGMLAPVTGACKIILRQISDLTLGWDDLVPATILHDWKKLSKTFFKLDDFSVPRKVFDSDKPFNLDIFTDSSKILLGYGFYITQNNQSKLLFAKNRLTPKPDKSIPTLELLSISLALKYLVDVLDMVHFPVHQINTITLYSDAQVALSWILNKAGPKRNLYACNRIKEIVVILEKLKEKNFNVNISYVDTQENPADLLTRPVAPSKFAEENQSYYNGPTWLFTGEKPFNELLSIPSKFISSDKRIVYQVSERKEDENENDKYQKCCIDTRRFASYQKCVNALSCAYKMADKFAKKELKNQVAYRELAINKMCSDSQKIEFPEVYDYLKDVELNGEDEQCASPPKSVLQLRLYLDPKGVVRSRSRLAKASGLTEDVINPILIAGSSDLARLFIHDSHVKSLHLGVSSTLNHLRQEGIWLTNGRRAVTKQLRENCVRCKRFNLPHFKSPSEADLPKERSNFFVSFEATGMDYAGPFKVYDSIHPSNKNKGVSSVYILLFTCLASRAIHLEVTPDLTTLSFIEAFTRFVNRYNIPKVLYSDNASTFKQGTNLLRTVITEDSVKSKLANLNIIVKNTPAYSPSQGGAWERMVGLTKTCLFKTFGCYTYPLLSFLTILSEVQLTINNRPLTYVSSEIDLEVITPNSLISMNKNFPRLRLDQENFIEVWKSTSSSEGLRDLAKTLSDQREMYNAFTQRWYKNYLASLRKYSHKAGYDKTQKWLTPGSICVLDIPGLKRAEFPLVKIIKALPDAQNRIRNVEIQRASGAKTVVSASLLVPLELDSEVKMVEETDDVNKTHRSSASPTTQLKEVKDTTAGLNDKPVRRSKRTAAIEAKDALKRMVFRGET